MGLTLLAGVAAVLGLVWARWRSVTDAWEQENRKS